MGNQNTRSINMTVYNSSGDSDGTSFGQAGEKVSVYGETPVVQASDIVAVTGTVSLTTTINALLTVVRNFGIIGA
jgi:hypothetical protein